MCEQKSHMFLTTQIHVKCPTRNAWRFVPWNGRQYIIVGYISDLYWLVQQHCR